MKSGPPYVCTVYGYMSVRLILLCTSRHHTLHTRWLSTAKHLHYPPTHTYQAYSLFASGLFNISADPSNPITVILKSVCVYVCVHISKLH